MNLAEIFFHDRILLDLEAADKEDLLDQLAQHAEGLTGINARKIGDALKAREELGSTCLGHGVAMPHARMPNLPHAVALVALLREPLDLDAQDQEPVDIVLMLLTPEGDAAEQIGLLSRVAALTRRPEILSALRKAACGEAAVAILTAADSRI